MADPSEKPVVVFPINPDALPHASPGAVERGVQVSNSAILPGFWGSPGGTQRPPLVRDSSEHSVLSSHASFRVEHSDDALTLSRRQRSGLPGEDERGVFTNTSVEFAASAPGKKAGGSFVANRCQRFFGKGRACWLKPRGHFYLCLATTCAFVIAITIGMAVYFTAPNEEIAVWYEVPLCPKSGSSHWVSEDVTIACPTSLLSGGEVSFTVDADFEPNVRYATVFFHAHDIDVEWSVSEGSQKDEVFRDSEEDLDARRRLLQAPDAQSVPTVSTVSDVSDGSDALEATGLNAAAVWERVAATLGAPTARGPRRRLLKGSSGGGSSGGGRSRSGSASRGTSTRTGYGYRSTGAVPRGTSIIMVSTAPGRSAECRESDGCDHDVKNSLTRTEIDTNLFTIDEVDEPLTLTIHSATLKSDEGLAAEDAELYVTFATRDLNLQQIIGVVFICLAGVFFCCCLCSCVWACCAALTKRKGHHGTSGQLGAVESTPQPIEMEQSRPETQI